jgi:hypothetical protein
VLLHVLHLLGPVVLQQAAANSSSAAAAAGSSSSSAAAAGSMDSAIADEQFADLVRQLVNAGETLHDSRRDIAQVWGGHVGLLVLVCCMCSFKRP